MMASGRRVVVAVAGYRVQSLLNGQRGVLKYLERDGQTGGHGMRGRSGWSGRSERTYYVPAQRREGFEKVSFGHTAKEAPA
jgi:hypothetical protein